MRTDHKRRTTLSPNLDHSLSRGEDLRRGKHHVAGLYLSSPEAWHLWDEIKSECSALVSVR